MAAEIVKDIYQENYDILCVYLDPGSLVGRMYSRNLLSDYEKGEIVEGCSTRTEKSEKLVDGLMRRGASGFEVFCEVLDKSSNTTHSSLARGLREAASRAGDCSTRRMAEGWNNVVNLTASPLETGQSEKQVGSQLGKNADQQPKLKDLVRLNIQGEWYDLGLQLDIALETLDSIKSDHKGDIRAQRTEMLKAWPTQASSPNMATWRVLLKALRDIRSRVNVWDVVKEHHLDSDVPQD